MTVHSALRHGALGASAVAAVTTLLLAAGCSAPPGTDTGDDVPEFAGTLGLPGSGNPGTGSPGVGAPGASNGSGTASGNTNTPPPASGAGGSANTSAGEQTGSGIGLQPAPSDASAGQSPGAGGSANVGAAPGSTAGAPGTAGSASMPPSDSNPPAQNPAPVNPQPSDPPVANCGAAFFCDDFESVADGASPNPAVWAVVDRYSVVEQSANVTVSGGTSHGGVRALRVEGVNSRTGVQTTVTQPSYFVRAWLNIDSAPLGPVFIGLGTDQNSETRLRIQGQSFATINTFGPEDNVHPGAANSGNCPGCVSLSPNRWFCAEMFVDNATQDATLWIDGVEAASVINGEGGWPVQPANPTVFLGSMAVQGGNTGVWIDDVAAGPERLGCE